MNVEKFNTQLLQDLGPVKVLKREAWWAARAETSRACRRAIIADIIYHR